MSNSPLVKVKSLELCLTDRESVQALRLFLNKLDKCCAALNQRFNLADILQDEGNQKSLIQLCGSEGLGDATQLILRVALSHYQVLSFTLRREIEGDKKSVLIGHLEIGKSLTMS